MLVKRIFDVCISFIGLIITGVPILLLALFAYLDTEGTGFFLQERIGQQAKPFIIFKLRTINVNNGMISNFGIILRKLKFDELPQLLNVFLGTMSMVGPRPDISGYYDKLTGQERKLLELKPGITSIASIKYKSEEELLAMQINPEKYNDEVIFPDKVKMNLYYYENRSLLLDVKIILKTLASIF